MRSVADSLSGHDVLVVVLVAVAARFVTQLALGFYVSPEAWEYDTLARNIVLGQGYVIVHDGATHRAFTFPLYPVLLAAIYAITGFVPFGVGVLQVVLGALLGVLIYAFARPTGRRVAMLAALAAAVHPGLLIYAAKIHALNLDAVLAAATALVARLALESPGLRTALMVGLASGIASLERTTFVPTLGLAIAAGSWRRLGPAATAGVLTIWLGLTVAFIGPWVVRNVVVLGTPVLTTTGSEILWRGNNPATTGSNYAADGRPMLEAVPEMRERVYGKPDVVQEMVFRDAALEYMRADPLRMIGWTIEKTRQFWWFGPYVGENYSGRWKDLYVAYYVATLGLVAVAVLAGRRVLGTTTLAAIALTLVPVSLLQALSYVEGRHRWAVEPLLLVLASVGLVIVLDRVRRLLRRTA